MHNDFEVISRDEIYRQCVHAAQKCLGSSRDSIKQILCTFAWVGFACMLYSAALGMKCQFKNPNATCLEPKIVIPGIIGIAIALPLICYACLIRCMRPQPDENPA